MHSLVATNPKMESGDGLMVQILITVTGILANLDQLHHTRISLKYFMVGETATGMMFLTIIPMITDTSVSILSKVSFFFHFLSITINHLECPSGFTYYPHTHKCYKFIREQLNWKECEAKCNTFGGNLASIHDLKTNDFLFSLMPTNAFIGGYKKSDGKWYWTDGSPMDYTHWYTGQPDNRKGVENYIEIFYSYGKSYWNDMSLVHLHPQVKHGFICQV